MTEYKPTLFDRHGPGALDHMRGFAYGLMVFGLVTGTLFTQVGFRWWVLPAGFISGAIAGSMGWLLGQAAGGAWKRFLVDGASTPYVEQYSYQQALVMRGEIDEALRSFEAVIVDKPNDVAPRLKAAELYSREKGDHQRAAALFREVQRIENVPPGDDVYASNRLVDLLTGPLDDPGRALVELRRLVDRYPGSAAAEHARGAIAELKERRKAASL